MHRMKAERLQREFAPRGVPHSGGLLLLRAPDAVAQGHGCWQDAESIIRSRAAAGLVFELTLGDDPVEAV